MAPNVQFTIYRRTSLRSEAGQKGGSAMVDISKFVDRPYEGRSFGELAAAPVSALQGVSATDAEALQKSLGIKTVHDLATNKFVLWAQAINVLANQPK
jgi:hypothetical protein